MYITEREREKDIYALTKKPTLNGKYPPVFGKPTVASFALRLVAFSNSKVCDSKVFLFFFAIGQLIHRWFGVSEASNGEKGSSGWGAVFTVLT